MKKLSPKASNKASNSGFTLVELAILIVITGVVIGGIVSGKDVLNNFKLNSVLTDFKKYEAAIYNFKTTYNYFPGDFPNASKVWGDMVVTQYGAQTTCGSSGCYATNGTFPLDGDGNQIIDWGGEPPFLWAHLYRAGLIDTKIIVPTLTFTDGQTQSGFNYKAISWVPGVSSVTNNSYENSVFSPRGNLTWNVTVPITKNGFSGHVLQFYKVQHNYPTFLESVDTSSTSARTFTKDDFFKAWKGTVILKEKQGQSVWNSTNGQYPALSSNDAYILDERFDDGDPANGILLAATSGDVYAKFNVHPDNRCIRQANGSYTSATTGAGIKYVSGNSGGYWENYDNDLWSNTTPALEYSRNLNINCMLEYKFAND